MEADIKYIHPPKKKERDYYLFFYFLSNIRVNTVCKDKQEVPLALDRPPESLS